MISFWKRVINKLRRQRSSAAAKLRKRLFPLWFVHPAARSLFFQRYSCLSFLQKEYLLSEYIQKSGTHWLHSDFTFEIRLVDGMIKVPIRAGFFAADMGLALCIQGLDAPVKHLYQKIFTMRHLLVDLRIVDVGVNFGQNLLLFCQSGKDVTGYEPNPNCFEEIRRVLSANDFSPRLINAAVGTERSELTLRWPSGFTWLGTVAETDHLQQAGHEKLEEVRVPVVALDDELSFTKEMVLLKIDVEGFETDVLAGSKNLLSSNDCLVVFEHDYSRSEGRRKIWAFLNAIGYDIFGIKIDMDRPLMKFVSEADYLSDAQPNHAAMVRGSIFGSLTQ